MSTAEVSGRGKLTGQIALISGGAQGIGQAIAECFQNHGAQVVLLDCDVSAAERTVRELNARNSAHPVRFLRADLEKPEEIRRAVEELQRDYGRLDILVNNAGIEVGKSLMDNTLADWDKTLNINLRGAFLLSQAALPLFPHSGGVILNISSIHATHAFPDSIPYACSKAGLVALTRNLALELGPRHIRVNAICPGYIDTRLWEEYLRQFPDSEAVAAQTAAIHPVGRRGLPADVAEAALFLVGPGSGFISGASLVVDGGLTIRTIG
ncbi:MAG: SDR family oxidoreductase [Acidobacteria bacterium]|nr:SDR family oxidoreductase [Acidobacteriota bacterium]